MLCPSCSVIGVTPPSLTCRNTEIGFTPSEDPSGRTGAQELNPIESETRHSQWRIFLLMLVAFIRSVLESIYNEFPFLPLVIFLLVKFCYLSNLFSCKFCLHEGFVAVEWQLPWLNKLYQQKDSLGTETCLQEGSCWSSSVEQAFFPDNVIIS